MWWTSIRLRCGANTVNIPRDIAVSSDPYILKNIEGLGPPEVVASISDNVDQGSVLKGRRPRNRQLVIRFGLNPNYAYYQAALGLRQPLYAQLMGAVDAIFMSGPAGDVEFCKAHGWVSKIETNHFSKDQEVSITIDCDSPYLKSDAITVNTGTLSKTEPILNHAGTAPSGFSMALNALENTYQFALVDINTGSYIEFIGTGGDPLLIAGDILSFKTTPGARFATRNRGGTVITLLGNIVGASSWLQLMSQSNHFYILNDNKNFNWVSVSIYSNYWGF